MKEKKLDFNSLYAAPEVMISETADERTDLYSVAVMMLEAWRGGGPVYQNTRRNRNLGQVLDGMAEERDPESMTHQIDYSHVAPSELSDGLVFKLLKKDPADRGFNDAQDVINYIYDTWPDVRKPAKDLYGKVMTTMRL